MKEFFVGPSFSGETYLKMMKPKPVFIWGFCIVTRSPEKYTYDFITEGKTREKIEWGGRAAFFDDMLDYNPKAIDP